MSQAAVGRPDNSSSLKCLRILLKRAHLFKTIEKRLTPLAWNPFGPSEKNNDVTSISLYILVGNTSIPGLDIREIQYSLCRRVWLKV